MMCTAVKTVTMQPDAIARGLRARDPDMLESLIEQYQHRLLRYLVCLLGEKHMAEDMFQETWMRLLERGHQYDGEREFGTWLFRVARNLVMDQHRKRRILSLDELMNSEHSARFEPVDPNPSASDFVLQQEQLGQLHCAFAEMPTDIREVVMLRFQEGLLLEEIARITSSPLSTVKSRLYRGVDLLMIRLKGAKA